MSAFEFFGKFTHSLDAKGRLILPARFRTPFDPAAYVTPHYDNCLALWTPETFSIQRAERAETENRSSDDRQRFRAWSSRVEKVQVDAQGRVPISAELRALAQLSSNAFVVGMVDRVEIWDPARWEAVVNAVDSVGVGSSGAAGE
ncbi:MAG: division/cell wall cluster transcriptional repressor MraZ [Acidimicrobiales bacterium]